jgi:hypothetical protein
VNKTKDRNGDWIYEGDIVRLTKAMRVDRVRKAKLVKINGGDLYVEVNLGCCGGLVSAHRYSNEMEKWK